jgi:hypothetical protein
MIVLNDTDISKLDCRFNPISRILVDTTHGESKVNWTFFLRPPYSDDNFSIETISSIDDEINKLYDILGIIYHTININFS